MQELRQLTAAAWDEQQAWVWHFRATVWQQQDELAAGAPTFLYAVVAPTAAKIGVAADPIARWKHLQVSNPDDLTLYAAVPATTQLERLIHRALRPHRIRGEWFHLHSPTLALLEELYGIAQILTDTHENDGAPVDAADTLQVLIDRVEDTLALVRVAA